MRKQLRSFNFWYFLLFTAALYLPILLLIIFSFNDAKALVLPLQGFTFKWYGEMLHSRELLNSVWNSVVVGVASSLIATILGTSAAIGVVRYRFPGRNLFMAVAAMPMVIPYVVLAVAMLLLFTEFNTLLQHINRNWEIPLSLWTVTLGHVIINIPLVLLIVAARLIGMEKNLEEAAMDLGATYWGTLARVTLPIAFPAMAAAFLTSFTTSFDEFALAFFLIGPDPTLPVYIYSQLRFPSRLPIVVTMASVIMVTSVLLIVLSEYLRRLGDAPARSASENAP